MPSVKNAKKIFCLTLGCSKNKADSEKIMGALRAAGFELADEADGADAAILNTCGFIRPAVEESVAAILDLAGLKAEGRLGAIGVAGCLVSRYGDELRRDMPEVDFWAGCGDVGTMLEALGADRTDSPSARSLAPGESGYVRHLKISDGCDRACSFCAIPKIKGRMTSRPVASLVEEAASLVSDGASEICLVAQDLSSYGADIGSNLIDLLDALESSLPENLWLRMFYLQPSGIDRAFLERAAAGRQLLPYLDIPVQHASPKILRAMNRGCDVENLAKIFETAREIRPDFALRTTCMVGFPGETRADFESLLKFMERVKFDRAGAFEFFPEEGTPAEKFPGQVAARTKKARLGRLMTLQENISLARQELFVGRKLEVIVDAVLGDGTAEARSFREAPEADGLIELSGAPGGVTPGDHLIAVMTGASEHDMTAEFVRYSGEREK